VLRAKVCNADKATLCRPTFSSPKALFAALDVLADFPQMARERVGFSPPVRMHPNGSHLILDVVQNGVVEIIRVLHARQDLMAFLGEPGSRNPRQQRANRDVFALYFIRNHDLIFTHDKADFSRSGKWHRFATRRASTSSKPFNQLGEACMEREWAVWGPH
jgi:hypothetical protein